MTGRNTAGHPTLRRETAAVKAVLAEERPYTARSVIASTLLGIDPPRLPARLLVRTGELFGIAEGTTRVAISRMVSSGELEPDDGHYRLAGHLLTRQARQQASRSPTTRPWQGQWRLAVVVAEGRSVAARNDLRAAMRALRLAERREGVWLRPDNLGPGPADAEEVVEQQCRSFVAQPETDVTGLVTELWDLDGWTATATGLQTALADLVGDLGSGDERALPAGFVVSAAALRHFQADPLLPDELLPDQWRGAELRRDYERYDRAFKALWRKRFADQR